MLRYTVLALALFSAHLLCAPKTALESARGSVGIYQGKWETFGIDDKNEIVKRFSWEDRAEATDPVQEGDRAFVSVVDTMINTPYAPQKWKEGFYVNKDGTAGERFVNMNDVVTAEKQTSPDTWAFASDMSIKELEALGFKSVTFQKHVMVKTTLRDSKVETEFVTRLSTVAWTDTSGLHHSQQFVSLKGFHTRKF